MASEHDQNSEFLSSRQHGRSQESHVGYDGDTQQSPAGTLLGLPGLMRCAGIGASCNASVRAEGMRQMQGTHGNHAVQRALSTNGPAGRVAVQRETFTEAAERYAKEMRNGQTTLPGNEPGTAHMGAVEGEQPFDPWLDGGVSIAEEGAIEESIAMLEDSRGGETAQSPAPYLPPAPPMQDVEESFLGRFLNVGDINNVVDVGTSSLGWMGDVSMAGNLFKGISPVADLVARSPGSSSLARNFAKFAPGGKALDGIGKGSDALGMAKG